MTTARDIMTPSPRCVGEHESLTEAARLLADLDVGSLPICGDDGKLKGMLTDRDIVVKGLAKGADPATTTAGELAEGKPVTVDADQDIRDALTLMQDHQVRRLPVIEDHLLVGIVSQADIALALAPVETGETVEQISL
ncbi:MULTISPECIES: CBS domain-containing protein [Microbacterium]|uniref:Hypoxic response protein 1 n=1 Tax=Microbacterium barkeri TaxID=33917 RepID=A0A9W6H5F2_9MICO|nr:CBS domain-containing protein [Microbacterium barkeri]MDR6878066.1 CBS domain-containing protein [Microbacterium barkeri]GLJ62987.1 hypoxic response protein 1 [Microbacterium barkeri]